ncbi:TRIO and F-actin binding protein b [Danio aesculapii]|uniref:TRIO and F-actin binding protein b n=1 Tax=Danio aesculapii TaxID=1142201 RepID=UPI0024BF22CA|nr:TRIO and F-actin binding protein b [Danio aesculapii]
MDLKGSQQKHEPSSRSGSPPSRRSYDSPTARKPDIKNLSYDRLNSSISTSRHDSRSQSPSRQSYDGRKTEIKSPSYERSHDRQSSSFSSKGRYGSRSQSPSGRPEDGLSTEGRRSASPVRKGYGTPSQSEPRSFSNRWRDERTSPAPTRKNYEGQTAMKKTEAKSRQSSPNRGSSLFRKPETSSNRGVKSRSSSPLAQSPSVLHNSESGRSHSVSTLRRDLADHIPMRSDRPSSTFRNSAGTQPRYDPIPSTDHWKGSAHSLHSQSASRHPSPTRHSGEKKQISFTQSVPVGWGVPQDSSRRSSSRPGHQEHTSRTPPVKTHTSTPSCRRQRSPSPPVQTHISTPGIRRHRSPSPPVQTHISTPSGRRHRSPSPPAQTHTSTPSGRRHRSPSPPAQTHTSSQSSMDSESSHLSAGSSGLNREEYAMMADLPKVKTVLQRESPSHSMRPEKREQSRYKPASHSHSKAPHSEWEDLEEDRESGTLSRAHSSSSLHTQGLSRPAAEHTHSSRSPGQKQKTHRPSVYFSCSVEQTDEEPVEQACTCCSGVFREPDRADALLTRSFSSVLVFVFLRLDLNIMTPDLLNFKKGWMSKLDESGEWRKHWFVLTDAGLKYYRDSAAEERDEVDGEIDLKACVKVSEFDVEKNYGFQIQTRDAVFTLSAMTAGIRRNWIEILRKNVRPGSSPDLTQLANCSSDKENTRHPSSLRLRSQSEASSTTINPAHNKFDYVELSPIATPPTPMSTNQRESGEGQVREHSQWQETRPSDDTHNQWEAVLSRKGAGQLSEQKRIEEEIERKWAEFERLPLKETRSLPAMGSRSSNQALEREVASLRQQLAELGAGQGWEGSGVGHQCCGAESRCSDVLLQMERRHRAVMEEQEQRHTQQISALEAQRDALLQEEARATATVMEALQKAHREELEKITQLKETRGLDSHTLNKQQQDELCSLRRELQALSERYSQQCVELKRAQQLRDDSNTQIRLKDTQMEQLRRDKQDLQARLTDEMKLIRSLATGQGSSAETDDTHRSCCEMQVLLRVRENELQYLHRELNSLRNQLHFLTTEKSSVCARYSEVCEELSVMKSRSERETETLREHLRLALNALSEGHNSPQH